MMQITEQDLRFEGALIDYPDGNPQRNGIERSLSEVVVFILALLYSITNYE